MTQTRHTPLHTLTLLYVEDDDEARESLTETLRHLFKELFIATDGEEGLRLFKQRHPDIVLSDIKMPKMDGLSMSRAIREIDPDVPIIITSAFSDSDLLLDAINSDIHYYLLKPIDTHELIDALHKNSEKILLRKGLSESLHVLNQYKGLLDTNVMVTKTDANGIITYANDAFCKVSGHTRKELIGQDHNIIRHPDNPDELFQELWNSIEQKERWHGVIKNMAKDGSFFISDTTIVPMMDLSGDIIEIIGIRYNFTKHKMANDRLEAKHLYSTYQEELAFKKQLNIIRNDYYYKLCHDEIKDGECLIDSYYRPLDILSGDSYSIRRLGQDVNFFLIVDGMGKGVSASLTAMLFTAQVNHIIDHSSENGPPLSLQVITQQAIDFIQPIMLEDEVLSAHLIRIDRKEDYFEHASFAMPAILTLDYEGGLKKITSNNPPISKYTAPIKIDGFSDSAIKQILLYSDGLIENSLKEPDGLYLSHIEEDFSKALTRDDMHQMIQTRLGPQEDDITFIMLSKLQFESSQFASRRVSCSMLALGEADQWYAKKIEDRFHDERLGDIAGYAFTELMLNAFEHGNLGITGKEKQKMIEDGDYWDILPEKEQVCLKETLVDLYDVHHLDSHYLITMITDEGEGFDTALLRDIFYRANKFHGRGIYISKRSSNGIYYNAKGNSVFTINQIKE